MIVTCPNCDTRFSVPDDALGGETGRRVRCASCGNVWRFTPEAAAIQAAVAEVAHDAHGHAEPSATAAPAHPGQPAAATPHAMPRTEGMPHGAGPVAQPRPSVVAEVPATRRPLDRRVMGIGLAAFAVGVVLIFVFARDAVMTALPFTAAIYESLDLLESTGAGLEVSVKPSRSADSVIIDGDIVNHARAVRQIPRLRVTLRDGYKVDLDSKVLAPPVAQLPPGAAAHFSTVFEHPSITAAGVEVSFATN